MPRSSLPRWATSGVSQSTGHRTKSIKRTLLPFCSGRPLHNAALVRRTSRTSRSAASRSPVRQGVETQSLHFPTRQTTPSSGRRLVVGRAPPAVNRKPPTQPSTKSSEEAGNEALQPTSPTDDVQHAFALTELRSTNKPSSSGAMWGLILSINAIKL